MCHFKNWEKSLQVIQSRKHSCIGKFFFQAQHEKQYCALYHVGIASTAVAHSLACNPSFVAVVLLLSKIKDQENIVFQVRQKWRCPVKASHLKFHKDVSLSWIWIWDKLNEMKTALYCCVCCLVNICQFVSHLSSPPNGALISLFSAARTNLSSFISLLRLQYESDELEKSVYQDYDSDSDVPDELKQDYVDEQTGDVPLKRSVPSSVSPQALSNALNKPAKTLEYSQIYLQHAKVIFLNAFSSDTLWSPWAIWSWIMNNSLSFTDAISVCYMSHSYRLMCSQHVVFSDIFMCIKPLVDKVRLESLAEKGTNSTFGPPSACHFTHADYMADTCCSTRNTTQHHHLFSSSPWLMGLCISSNVKWLINDSMMFVLIVECHSSL